MHINHIIVVILDHTLKDLDEFMHKKGDWLTEVAKITQRFSQLEVESAVIASQRAELEHVSCMLFLQFVSMTISTMPSFFFFFYPTEEFVLKAYQLRIILRTVFFSRLTIGKNCDIQTHNIINTLFHV